MTATLPVHGLHVGLYRPGDAADCFRTLFAAVRCDRTA